MVGSSIVMLLLAATPAKAPKLASPGISSVNVTPALQTFVTDHLNQQLVLAGVDVLRSSEVAALLGLERHKQLVGCGDGGACIAEFSNALGVDGLLLGNLARFGATIQLDVRVAAASDARSLATVSIRIPDESGLLDAIAQAAAGIAKQLSESLKVSLTPIAQPSATVAMKSQWTAMRTAGMWTFVASSAVLIGGAIALFGKPGTEATTASTLGLVFAILASPGILIGGLMWIFGGSELVPVKAALFPFHDGFVFALSGVF